MLGETVVMFGGCCCFNLRAVTYAGQNNAISLQIISKHGCGLPMLRNSSALLVPRGRPTIKIATIRKESVCLLFSSARPTFGSSNTWNSALAGLQKPWAEVEWAWGPRYY